ncbi:hypothetical protein HRG_010293 [Hirsutella rhossiliensis]|uniref:YTH domain-containing protein n=1 Tax=Hirsutella rhossiliensis TaxID=111463 RepID=A0A9P8SDH7_9HYPO|nr:uncharacterized protein HRG_10293 [Hirsutella rhossiliensis]KAH0958606.1 hypothetical protein HRG_10293 [Hirsutella rhossiliensis]
MDPAAKQQDPAAPTADKAARPVTQTPRETPVAAPAAMTPDTAGPDHDDALSAPLRALLRHDAELRLWLLHTGYFEPARRERVLEGIRKLRAVDEERDKLVLELRTSAGGLFHGLPFLPLASPLSSPSFSSTSASAAAGFDALPATNVAAVRLTAPPAAQVAPSYSASTAASSVAGSVRGDAKVRREERDAGPEELPSPLVKARLGSGSGRVGSAAHGRADTRFFLLKSFDSANIYMSQRDGLWATQAKNGPIFAEAFEECQSVIFFFSINKSRAFQGFARMTSAPDPTLHKPDWVQNINLSAITEPFRIEWISTAETEFDSVGDLKNPLNEFRSVVVGRDGQEYSPDCGRKMMALLNRQPAAARKPARSEIPRLPLAEGGRQARARARSPRGPYDGARGPSQWRKRQRDMSVSRSPPGPIAPAGPTGPSPCADSLNLIDC